MLSGYFKGESTEKPVDEGIAKKENLKAARRAALDAEPEAPTEMSEEEKSESRDNAIRKKLADSAKEAPHQQQMTAYDGMFRNATRILLDSHMADLHEGLQLSLARNAQNAMVSSKWLFGTPQQSHWEVNIQMNGFTDVMSVSYNTLNRWQLMYQRMFSSGAMAVLQFMAQPQAAAMGGPPGTFFGMVQYPWVRGGCTQLQYVRSQQVSLSHCQRLIRGVYVAAQMSTDLNTNSTNMTYAGMSASGKTSWSGEYKPHSGEWKVATTRSDWGTDTEMACQIENSDKRNGKVCIMSVGVRKNLIGGGNLSAVLSGFSRLKAILEMPFGCERAGFNQLMFSYNAQYDINTGGLKHGISMTL